MFDSRTVQTILENLLRDSILYALGTRLPQVATVAALRAVSTMGASNTPSRLDDDLITVAGTPLKAFRWNTYSNASDDGTNVIRPSDVPTGNRGRWIKWTSVLRFAQTIGDDAVTLDQNESGHAVRVIALDKSLSVDELINLLAGQVPAIVIESVDDDPDEATQNVGQTYLADYNFNVHCIVENLRDRREAAQGSEVTSDNTLGANTLDGLVQALICGTRLYPVIEGTTDGIRTVQKGRGYNWISDYAQGRVIRSRSYTVRVSEEIPAYESDTAVVNLAVFQAQLVGAGEDGFDVNNYLASGCAFVIGGALSQALSAGAAVIDGEEVAYAGEAVTLPAYSDTYYDLSTEGDMTLTSVTAGGSTPAVAADSMRIGRVTTNGLVVVGVELLVTTIENYGPEIFVPLS